MIISISGLDGSGKSTQIGLLADYCAKNGLECRVRHLIKDSLSYFLTHKVIGSFSKKTQLKVESGIRKKDRGLEFYFLSVVKKILLLIEMIYFNVRFSRYKRCRTNVLICDRYFYDAIVQIEYLGIAGKIYRDIYLKMIKAPDLSLYLKTDPETAYERKNEFDIDYFIKKEKLYAEVFGENTVVIEPAGVEDAREKIQEIVRERELFDFHKAG